MQLVAVGSHATPRRTSKRALSVSNCSARCSPSAGTHLDHCVLLMNLQDLGQMVHALLVDREEPLHVAVVDFKFAVVSEPLLPRASSQHRSSKYKTAHTGRARGPARAAHR